MLDSLLKCFVFGRCFSGEFLPEQPYNSSCKISTVKVEDGDDSKVRLTPTYFSDEDLKPSDVINIKLQGISCTYYNYSEKYLMRP